jgi:hypothetical protein
MLVESLWIAGIQHVVLHLLSQATMLDYRNCKWKMKTIISLTGTKATKLNVLGTSGNRNAYCSAMGQPHTRSGLLCVSFDLSPSLSVPSWKIMEFPSNPFIHSDWRIKVPTLSCVKWLLSAYLCSFSIISQSTSMSIATLLNFSLTITTISCTYMNNTWTYNRFQTYWNQSIDGWYQL